MAEPEDFKNTIKKIRIFFMEIIFAVICGFVGVGVFFFAFGLNGWSIISSAFFGGYISSLAGRMFGKT